MVNIEAKRSERQPGSAPPGVTPRRAQKNDVVADPAYKPHDISYLTPEGEWVTVTICARQLPWVQRSRIEDKHTKVAPMGRTHRVDVDSTAVMHDVLTEMIDGPKCDPPLTREDIQTLNGPLYDELVAYFRLNRGASQEVEENAGKSARRSAKP